MKILIIKMSSMGDIVHTFPAITDALHANPAIEFDWVVEEGFADVPRWHPAVKRVLPVAFRRWRKNLFSRNTKREFRNFLKHLRYERYDLIIDAQGLMKSVLFTVLAKGKRAGFNWHSAREPFASIFYQQRINVAKDQHAVQRIRELFAKALNYKYDSTTINYSITTKNIAAIIDSTSASIRGWGDASSEFRSSREDVSEHEASPQPRMEQRAQDPNINPYCLFIPNTSWKTKHWPTEYWRELLTKTEENKIPVIMPGGYQHELPAIQAIANGFSNVTILPQTTLNDLREIISHATAIVSVDTGLAHIAAACSIPTITLYGPTDPAKIGTLGQHQFHLQAATDNMNTITPEQVWTSLSRLWTTHGD